MNKILVTGSSGMVGSRFLELSNNSANFLTPGEQELNLTSSENVRNYFLTNKPKLVIHFAAYTNVSEGEKQRGDKNGLCWKLNVTGVENLIENCDADTYFVNISTDMVFAGSKNAPGPYEIDEKPEANESNLTWYGWTKNVGEKRVIDKLGKSAAIVRIICPVRAKFNLKSDFLRKPLQLYDEGKLYPLFVDQQVCFSFIDEIVTVLDRLIETRMSGIFHASSADTTSPYNAVSYLIEKARGKKNVVQKSLLADFLKSADSSVRYPMFGGLKVGMTESKLGVKFRTCREIIDELVRQGI